MYYCFFSNKINAVKSLTKVDCNMKQREKLGCHIDCKIYKF